MSLPTSSRALSSAAPEMMAVPCWSSWKTGMESVARSFSSMAKQSGERMSSRLMPPTVGSRSWQKRIRSSGFSDPTSRSNVDVGERLEENPFAFHDGLSGQRADVAETEHRGAVRDDGDEVAFGRV